MEPIAFDPKQRAAEKQASREADERALANGARSPEQLRRENAPLAQLKFVVDFSSAAALF